MGSNGQKFSKVAINKFITRTALSAVFIMGFVSAFSILDRPADEAVEANSSISGLGQRAPASLGSIAEINAAVLDLDCIAKSFHIIGAQQVRIRGSVCEKSKGARLTSSKITNSTNGAMATVFLTDGSKFTTDYIQLNKGVNLITMEYQLSTGVHQTSNLQIQSE